MEDTQLLRLKQRKNKVSSDDLNNILKIKWFPDLDDQIGLKQNQYLVEVILL